jgi:hypothetical protein
MEADTRTVGANQAGVCEDWAAFITALLSLSLSLL